MESNVIKSMCDNDTVRYTNTSAVSAGELIFVSGLGVLRATAAYDADTEGVYQKNCVVTVPITSAVTISQGDKCYWDKSANKIITTGMIEEDFYLGRAVDAGSAAGGYADVDLGPAPIDYRASDGKTAKRVLVAADTALLSAATTQVPLATGLLSTDILLVQMNSAGANDGANNVPLKAVPSDGYFTATFTSAPTNGGLSWAAFRAV